MIKIKNTTFFLIFFAILLHFLFIKLNSVNHEYIFVVGHNFIKENFNKEFVNNFFEQQANTFFFSFIVSFFSFLFPFFKPLFIGKFISILSYLFFGLAVINIFNSLYIKKDIDKSRSLFLILLFANPIIWTFGYRSTPDLISAALAFYSFSFFYLWELNKKNYNCLRVIIPSFILGFATAIKPIVGIFLIASISIMKINLTKNFFKKIFLIGLFYSIVPVIYFYFVYKNFNFFLFHPKYQQTLSIFNNYEKFISNFILYTSFLFIFILPIYIGRFLYILKSLRFSLKIINILLIILIFFIGRKYIYLSIEMSFGLFDRFFDKDHMRGILSVISYFFICVILKETYIFYINKYKKDFFLLMVSVIYLLIISLSLPSQRYLITIVPLLYCIFRKYYQDKLNFIFILLICIPVNIILLANQYLTSSLSSKITQILYKNNMISKVCFGAIAQHVAGIFTHDENNCNSKDFHIVYGLKQNSLYSVSDSILFLNKSYSVIKVR